ncbi:MAG: exodeoxyribonuclease III [Chloroflexi bacterium HGW-Chloroflexi-2]|jgi:exodeoxyribonuclease-3|nr:MAG: exodeoxyribonuclease III [Chloroflexi bacterium HGW-Chloroflexi-2]
MKITTWNVNGIRAAINKGFVNWSKSYEKDVLCLQEIKAFPEQIPEEVLRIDSYKTHINSAKRPGYSGVASFFKAEPLEIRYGLGIEAFDDEGRVIRSKHENFYLYNIYFPNGQRGQDRVDFKLAFYETLLSECNQLHEQGEHVIITGDFNTAHTEIDLANPKENAKTSGFLPEEREMITKYLNHGFKDAYRELYPDKVEYTWWTYRFGARRRNIGWRLDYFLVSDGLLKDVNDVIILGDVEGSDHCPVTLIIGE